MNLEAMDRRELVDTYLMLLERLKCRGLMPIYGNLTGGLSEWIACQALSLTPRRGNTRDIDAVSEDGNTTYQIKGRRNEKPNTVHTGIIHGLELRPFQFLVAIVFDGQYLVHRALVVPYDTVLALAEPNDRNDGHYLKVDADLAGRGDVYDFSCRVYPKWRPIVR